MKPIDVHYTKPLAEPFAYKNGTQLKPQPVMSKIEMHYDPTEPLSEKEWPTAP